VRERGDEGGSNSQQQQQQHQQQQNIDGGAPENTQNRQTNGKNKQTQTQAQNSNPYKKMNVMYTNADVLTNKMDLLKTRCLAEMPHIVGVNEVKPKNMKTKLYSAEFNLEDIGFDMFPNNVEEDKGRGQVLYVSKDFKGKRVILTTVQLIGKHCTPTMQVKCYFWTIW